MLTRLTRRIGVKFMKWNTISCSFAGSRYFSTLSDDQINKLRTLAHQTDSNALEMYYKFSRRYKLTDEEAEDKYVEFREELKQQPQESQVFIDFNNSDSFWETFDEFILEDVGFSTSIEDVNNLTFYRNCTPHPSPYCNDDVDFGQFDEEIERKIELIQKTRYPLDREPVQATFNGPGGGKSRLVDELASRLNNKFEEIPRISLSVTYNYQTSPVLDLDCSSDEITARSAFLWRILASFSSRDKKIHTLLEKIHKKISNYQEITLDNVIDLIENHPALKSKVQDNNMDVKLILYIAVDEILRVNQTISNSEITNSYNIIRTIGRYYDSIYSESSKNKILVHFFVSSLCRAGFGETTPTGREFSKFDYNMLSISNSLEIIFNRLGQDWKKAFDDKGPLEDCIIFCSGYPFALNAICEKLQNKTVPSDDVSINALRKELYGAVIDAGVERGQPQAYQKLFSNIEFFYQFLSCNNIPPLNKLTPYTLETLNIPDKALLYDVLRGSNLSVSKSKFCVPNFILYYLYTTSDIFKNDRNIQELFNLLSVVHNKPLMAERFLAVYEVFHSRILGCRDRFVSLSVYFRDANPSYISTDLLFKDENDTDCGDYVEMEFDVSELQVINTNLNQVPWTIPFSYNNNNMYWAKDDNNPLFDYGSLVSLNGNTNALHNGNIWLLRQVSTITNDHFNELYTKLKNHKSSTKQYVQQSEEDVRIFLFTHAEPAQSRSINKFRSELPPRSLILFQSNFNDFIHPSFQYWWKVLSKLPAK